MNSQAPANGIGTAHSVCVWAPATLSNLGPGFDCLGLAIEHWGDEVCARFSDEPGVHILYHSDSVWSGAPLAEENTAGRAALHIARQIGARRGIDLEIRKGVRPGSGVGSSAASAAAAACAVNHLFEEPLSKEDLVDAVLAGERIASGSEHGDNVLPSLFGDVVLASAANPRTYRRLHAGEGLWLSIVLPDVEILTKSSRSALPSHVPLEDAVANASHLALLVDAVRAGDWEVMGTLIMSDRIVEPVRAGFLPWFERLRRTALDAGAWGCALSGSGPAVFAVSKSKSASDGVLRAMTAVLDEIGVQAHGLSTTLDRTGARKVVRRSAIEDAV